jgi:hypothetical protein
VNVVATFGAIIFVDLAGRRRLLIIASIWMFVTQVIVAIVLGIEFQRYGAGLPKDVSIGMLVVSVHDPLTTLITTVIAPVHVFCFPLYFLTMLFCR